MKLAEELADALQGLLDRATPGNWTVYTSNSWRRIGKVGEYKEIVYPVRHHHDSHPDLSGPNVDNDLALLTGLQNHAADLIAGLRVTSAPELPSRWVWWASAADSGYHVGPKDKGSLAIVFTNDEAQGLCRAHNEALAATGAPIAPPTDAEIAAYRDLFRAELDKRMDTNHPSASPSTESHAIALRRFVETRNTECAQSEPRPSAEVAEHAGSNCGVDRRDSQAGGRVEAPAMPLSARNTIGPEDVELHAGMLIITNTELRKRLMAFSDGGSHG